MRSHGLRQLVDDLLVPSVLSKLVINYGKFFQQVVTNLEMTNWNNPDFDRLGAI